MRTFADFGVGTWWEDKPQPVLVLAMLFIGFIFLSIEDIAVQIEASLRRPPAPPARPLAPPRRPALFGHVLGSGLSLAALPCPSLRHVTRVLVSPSPSRPPQEPFAILPLEKHHKWLLADAARMRTLVRDRDFLRSRSQARTDRAAAPPEPPPPVRGTGGKRPWGRLLGGKKEGEELSEGEPGPIAAAPTEPTPPKAAEVVELPPSWNKPVVPVEAKVVADARRARRRAAQNDPPPTARPL